MAVEWVAEWARNTHVGEHFWARGFFASTVGRDEQVIRDYIRHQEAEDRRIGQMSLICPLGGLKEPCAAP